MKKIFEDPTIELLRLRCEVITDDEVDDGEFGLSEDDIIGG